MYKPLYYEGAPFTIRKPPENVCATNLRHCATKKQVLRVVKNPGPQLTVWHSNILAYKTGKRLYRLAVHVGFLKDIKFVCDGYTGNPIIRLKGPTWTWIRPKFHMRGGDDSSEIVTECNMKVGGKKVNLIVEFDDVETGVRKKVCLKGSRWSRNFDFFLGDAITGTRVAKMYQPKMKMGLFQQKDDYHILIAEGVDTALILAMALAVDTYLG